MPEHKRLTTSSKYRGEGARAVCVSNESLLPSPSAQRTTPSKTASSLLDFLILCHKGQEVEPWTVFDITPEEVRTVWSMLERHKSLYDYTLGKLRFDWSPHTPRFTVRMPTSMHDIFTELVAQEIGSQLKSVSRGDTDVAAVLALVRSESTSDVYLYGHEALDERYPKHTPDASFAHAYSQYPSVVIETSYSQQQKELTRLVDEYVSGSDRNIAVVLGLDIEYGVGSKNPDYVFSYSNIPNLIASVTQ